MSLKYYGRKVYEKRNGQICRPQKCRVKFGKNCFEVQKNIYCDKKNSKKNIAE